MTRPKGSPGARPEHGPEPAAGDPLHELDVLLRTRYGLILIDSPEHERVTALLRHAADRRGLPLFEWSRTRGLSRSDVATTVYDTAEPAGALAHIEAARVPALYHLPGLHEAVQADGTLAARLADAARALEAMDGAIVLTGAGVALPASMGIATARLRLPAPDAGEFRQLLARVLADVASRMHVEVEMPAREQEHLLASLRGLTLMEAEKLLTRAIVEDGRLASHDIQKVLEAKRRVVEEEGLLEYYPVATGMDDIADLAGLKHWLAQRRAIIAEPERAREFGLEFPRGILLLGVPGSGKSLCARAVASDWRLPLLKLDPSNLYNKYVGESERNFQRAMRTAERMAPVVLWIDELEKAFAAGDADGGVSRRVLGSFLSWMQERRGDVFIVATANDIQRLPPEFMRKGRFDEIFFVDLPDAETRAEIFRIHLRRRGQDATGFDLDTLAQATDGFSGAEVEQVVVAALYTAFSAGRPLDTATLLAEARRTRPLSVTMAERVQSLREWARGRTRSAQAAGP